MDTTRLCSILGGRPRINSSSFLGIFHASGKVVNSLPSSNAAMARRRRSAAAGQSRPQSKPIRVKMKGFRPRAFNMCGDVAAPNLYAVAQQNCLQAPDTSMTVMGRRSGSSSSNDDVERAGPQGS